MDYLVWSASSVGSYCALKYLENVEDPHELKRGISRANDFPSDAYFHMDDSHPKQIKLADNIYNLDRMLVVSKGLKGFAEVRKPAFTEFLQVTIYNHKGRIATEDYFIINPFKLQDCIDLENSDIEWNSIDPELICGCFELVIDVDRIDPDLLLFRPKYMPTVTIVREDLAEGIIGEGFTGNRFVAIDEFEL